VFVNAFAWWYVCVRVSVSVCVCVCACVHACACVRMLTDGWVHHPRYL